MAGLFVDILLSTQYAACRSNIAAAVRRIRLILE